MPHFCTQRNEWSRNAEKTHLATPPFLLTDIWMPIAELTTHVRKKNLLQSIFLQKSLTVKFQTRNCLAINNTSTSNILYPPNEPKIRQLRIFTSIPFFSCCFFIVLTIATFPFPPQYRLMGLGWSSLKPAFLFSVFCWFSFCLLLTCHLPLPPSPME